MSNANICEGFAAAKRSKRHSVVTGQLERAARHSLCGKKCKTLIPADEYLETTDLS